MADMMDITKLTVEQLKSELLKYNLETKGRKSELLARLVDHLEACKYNKYPVWMFIKALLDRI